MEISFISLLVKTVLEFFIEGQEAAYRPGDFNPNFITFFRHAHTHTQKPSDMSPNTKRQEKAFYGSPPSFLKTSCSDRHRCFPPLHSPASPPLGPPPLSEQLLPPHPRPLPLLSPSTQAGLPCTSLSSPLPSPHSPSSSFSTFPFS